MSQFRQIKQVAEEGDLILGNNGNLTLFSTGVTSASVNGDGSVAFNGKFSPVASPLEKLDGVFVWTGGKFLQQALEGTCIPTVGGSFGGASDPHINDSGKVVFFNPWMGSTNGCSPLATNSLQPPRYLSGWAQVKDLVGMFLPSPARAQSTSSNVGVYATVSSLDPDRDLILLTVSKEGTGSGTVTSAPAGIDCGMTCQGSFDSGTEVTLMATPAAGSVFAGWSGDADCADGTVTMDVDKTCTANLRDATLPTSVQVTAPTSGQTISGTFALKGTAQDNSGTIQKMEFYIDADSTPVCADTAPKATGSLFQCSWDTTTKANGGHTVKAKAYDPSGNATLSASVSFTIDNVPPTNVRVSRPNSGQKIAGTFTLKASAQDNSGTVQKMEFYIDDTMLACSDTAPKSSGSTFACDWDTATKANGSHTVKAKAYDPSGNSAVSAAVSFTVKN